MYALVGSVSGSPVRFPLPPGKHLVGRGSRNDIDLQNASVSRRHAELEVAGDTVHVRDLGSSNGTWVNDLAVTEPVELRPGDRLRFGDQELRLRPDDDTAWDAADDAAGMAAEPPHRTTISGIGLVDVPLSDPQEVSTSDRLSWETASSERVADPSLDRALFRAVTEAGQLLVIPRPLSETFETVLGIVEGVIPARRILLLLTDTPDGTPAVRAARPAEALSADRLMLSQTIIGTVLRDREALLLNDALSDPRFRVQESIIIQEVRSAMVAPLFDNTRVLGLLYADNNDPRIHYDRNQLRAFTLLANLIAVKITNARLLEVERKKERMEQEVAAAKKVQNDLLPSCLPEVTGYEILARQLPGYEVAGDLYDVARLADGRIFIVVGDVTGKGLPAALLMSNAMACLRVLYPEALQLDRMASRMHQELLESSDATHFVTLFIGLLDPRQHRLDYVNAGHNPPQLICGEEPPISLAPTGMPLGLMAGATYSVSTIPVPDDSLLCIFSDGIPEAMRGDEDYGEDRLIASVRQRCGQTVAEIADGALADLRAFLGDEPAGDDVTLLLLRRRPPAS